MLGIVPVTYEGTVPVTYEQSAWLTRRLTNGHHLAWVIPLHIRQACVSIRPGKEKGLGPGPDPRGLGV